MGTIISGLVPHGGLNPVVVYLIQLVPAGRVDDHARLEALAYQALDN